MLLIKKNQHIHYVTHANCALNESKQLKFTNLEKKTYDKKAAMHIGPTLAMASMPLPSATSCSD